MRVGVNVSVKLCSESLVANTAFENVVKVYFRFLLFLLLFLSRKCHLLLQRQVLSRLLRGKQHAVAVATHVILRGNQRPALRQLRCQVAGCLRL